MNSYYLCAAETRWM